MANADAVNQPQPSIIKSPPRLGIKLNQDAQERVKANPNVLSEILEQALPGSSNNVRIERLITSVEPAKMDELVKRATDLDPTYVPVDFNAWYQVHFDPGSLIGDASEAVGTPGATNPGHITSLVSNLHSHPDVSSAFHIRPQPPPVSPDDDPLSSKEGYLDPAPNGIDARYAWTKPGGDGTGVGFVDMEQGWDLNHEDLAAANITLISGENHEYFFHGTSVLGEILMVDNNIGGVGIAPNASARVISQWQPDFNTPAAIAGAVAVMNFGDVLLLEAQTVDPWHADDNPNDPDYWKNLMPVEVEDATYDAIRLATASGIIVIEAGANGNHDLDAYKNLAGLQIFNRSSPDFRDSGAIMVGAASSTLTQPPRSRLWFSSYGSRIDVYAWGESVETTNTDETGTNNTLYTGTFSGTSSASPIIAGAALLVQGIAQVQPGGSRLSPPAMRRILLTGATPSADPANDRIGVMPNLRAIVDQCLIVAKPDVYIRDYVGDTGETTSGMIYVSPDIIVRQNPVPDPQKAFGQGSGNEDNNALSDEVLTGRDQSVYVRVLNRGGSDAANVSVTVYCSAPSTFISPKQWTKIGTTTFANAIPQGNILTVSEVLTWPAASIPNPGHYCFVALAGNAQDPAPNLMPDFPSLDAYIAFIEDNRQAAWRNFNVIQGPSPAPQAPQAFVAEIQNPPPSATHATLLPETNVNKEIDVHRLHFVIPGAFDGQRTFRIETFSTLPANDPQCKVELSIPHSLTQALQVKLPDHQHASPGTNHASALDVIPLPSSGRYVLGQESGGVLEQGSLNQCELRIQIPKTYYSQPGGYRFSVKQLYLGKDVGRVTWHFGKPHNVAGRQ